MATVAHGIFPLAQPPFTISSYPHILGALTAIAVATILGIAFYRLSLHPLAKFPGPFWARLTTFPSYWHTVKGDRHIWLWQLQQKYGSSMSCSK